MGPTTLDLFATARCNTSCWFCTAAPHRKDPRPQDATPELVQHALDLFPELRSEAYVGGHGESLCCERIGEIIELLANNFDSIAVSTNGQRILKMRDELPMQRMGVVSISVNEVDHEAYREAMGADRLDDVVGGIELLLSLGARVMFTFVISRRNVHRMPDYMLFTDRYGVDVAFMPFLPRPPAFEDDIRAEGLVTGDPVIAEQLRQYREFGDKLGLRICRWPEPLDLETPNKVLCSQPGSHLVLDGSGDIATCCAGPGPRREVGNILEQGRDAWFSPHARWLRTAVNNAPDAQPEKCRYCTIRRA
jgi:radical SAM protein with 4Fe4S-binding SPASM domain